MRSDVHIVSKMRYVQNYVQSICEIEFYRGVLANMRSNVHMMCEATLRAKYVQSACEVIY